jgi:hypothetical protein
MRYITVQSLGRDLDKIRRQLSKDRDLVVTCRGKPIAILSAVDEGEVEPSLAALRRARGMAAMKSMQATSRRLGNHRMSMKQIDTEIAAARRERRR